MRSPSRFRVPVVALLGSALLLLSGCQATSDSAGLIHRVEGAKLSEHQLRTLMNDFVRRFIDQVDAATMIVLDRETDPETRKRALLFRMNSTAACAVAASDNDPVAALVDIWALSLQMRHYYESADAAAQMKAYRDLGVATCRTLQEQTEEIARELTNSERLEEFSADLEAWAREHPVEAPFYGRPSTVPHFSKEKTEIRQGLLDVVPGLDQRMADLSGRLAFYATLLPKQVRWEAEFLMSVVATPGEYRQAIESVQNMTASLELIAKKTEEVEAIIDRQREEIVAALHDEADDMLAEVDRMRVDAFDRISEERREVFIDIDRQRKETIDVLTAERKSIFASITSEREAAFEALRGERETTLISIDELRVATLSDVRKIAQESIGEGTDRARALLDRALRRGFAYGMGFVGVLFAAGFAFVWLVRKTRT